MWGPVLGTVFMIVGFLAEIGIFMIKAESLNETLEKREQEATVTFPGATKRSINENKKQV